MHVYEHHDATLTFHLTLDDTGNLVEECWLADAQEEFEDVILHTRM